MKYLMSKEITKTPCCNYDLTSSYLTFGMYYGGEKRHPKWFLMGYDDADGEMVEYCPFCGKKLVP